MLQFCVEIRLEFIDLFLRQVFFGDMIDVFLFELLEYFVIRHLKFHLLAHHDVSDFIH